ncbi:UNVERIFIED_CONTAM: hypothetical protein HDU68_011499 [Siphonaria sp. JEL0065]|nr:hypothetical protein HDU68_011499 [Siphonaria sp. JEL0065]
MIAHLVAVSILAVAAMAASSDSVAPATSAAPATSNAPVTTAGPTSTAPPQPTTISTKTATTSFAPCSGDNWDRGNVVDPNAPPGPYPVAGQQVYIKDNWNFCINLPNPDDPTMKQLYYDKGLKPTVVQAEGYVRSFCVGESTPGSLPMPVGAITSAHVIKNYTSEGKHYMQITGHMNCDVLNINCQGDNGGQYDSVPYRNCGKEPYSGVDTKLNPTFENYVEQAGDGIFCMRTCQGGLQLDDPCNVKNDTAGCEATMGFNTKPGFTFFDVATGSLTELPPSTTTSPSIRSTTTPTATSKSGAFQVAGYVSMALASVVFAML